MHAVPNQVEIPIDEIETLLVSRAVPDFTGTVEITVHVSPAAAHEVEFRARVESHIDVTRSDDKAEPVVTNERVARVRRHLAEVANKFVLGTAVTGIKASFVRGELRSFKLCEAK